MRSTAAPTPVPPPPAIRIDQGGRKSAYNFVAPGHDLELAPNRVLDGNDRPSLEFKGWQHRGELVHFNGVIAIGQHVAAPIANPNYEHLYVETGWFFPFAKHVENSLLRPLVLDCRTLRAFIPGDHVFHAQPPRAP